MGKEQTYLMAELSPVHQSLGHSEGVGKKGGHIIALGDCFLQLVQPPALQRNPHCLLVLPVAYAPADCSGVSSRAKNNRFLTHPKREKARPLGCQRVTECSGQLQQTKRTTEFFLGVASIELQSSESRQATACPTCTRQTARGDSNLSQKRGRHMSTLAWRKTHLLSILSTIATNRGSRGGCFSLDSFALTLSSTY